MTTFTLKLKIKSAILGDKRQNDIDNQKWCDIRAHLKKTYGFGLTVNDLCNDELITIPEGQKINVNAVLTLFVMERCLNKININESAMVLRKRGDKLCVTVVIETNRDTSEICEILNELSETIVMGKTDIFIENNAAIQLYFDKEDNAFKTENIISCEKILYAFRKYIEHAIEKTTDTILLREKLKATGLRETEINTLFKDLLI